LVVPGPGCLYGNWNEDVAVGQLPVFGFLVRSGLVSCRPGRGRRVSDSSEVWVGICVWYCDIPCQRFAFCRWQQRDTVRTLAIVTLLILLLPKM